MNNVELYIQSTDGDYIAIDIFDNENIQIEDSIQDVRDISKIFNTFTRDFKVPASFDNNKLFKHYYNLNIDNGFDARIKTRAIIKVGGVDYKRGFLRLLSVGLNNNKPSFYKLTFQGLITSLKDVLNDDKLSDLDFADLNFANNVQTIVSGIRTGLYVGSTPQEDDDGEELYPDVIYAPIFSNAKVVAIPFGTYSTGNTNNEPQGGSGTDFSLVKFTGVGASNVSVENDDGTFKHDPITPYDFKPSIKMGRILKMINDKYGLNMQDSFLWKEEIDQLYMLFNGERKQASISNSSNAFAENASSNTSIESTANNSVTYTTEGGQSGNPISFTTTSGGGYNKLVPSSGASGKEKLDNNLGVFKINSNTSDADIRFTIRQYYYKTSGERVNLSVKQVDNANVGTYDVIGVFDMPQQYFEDNIVGRAINFDVTVTSSAALAGNVSISFDYSVFQEFEDDDFIGSGQPIYTTSVGQSVSAASSTFLDIQGLSPDIKLIDILTGVFKMFNMTAYIDSNEELVIQTLQQYYENGDTIDLTDQVHIDSHSVSNGFNYKNVIMKYQESKDVMTKNFRGNGDIGFGDIRVDKSTFLQGEEDEGGRDYIIKLPFERMMFENLAYSWDSNTLSGSFTGDPTDLVIGNCIDDKLEQIETKPILFYGKQINTNLTSKSNGDLILTSATSADSNNNYGLATNSQITYNGSAIGSNQSNIWWNPSGIMASNERRDGDDINSLGYFQGLSFDNTSYDEFEYDDGNNPSDYILGLYQANYKSYLKGVYLKNSRLTKFKVSFKQGFIHNYKLNDIIVIGTNQYYINSIKFDLLSGKGDIELVNKIDMSLS